MEDLEFTQIYKLVNYRLSTGQSNGMTECIEFTKIQLLNTLENCIERIFKMGYLAMEVNENVDLTHFHCIEVHKFISIFDKHLVLAKNRYITDQTKDLKELLSIVKMIITQDPSHSMRRLISEGYEIIVDPKCQTIDTENKTNDGHGFDDILG